MPLSSTMSVFHHTERLPGWLRQSGGIPYYFGKHQVLSCQQAEGFEGGGGVVPLSSQALGRLQASLGCEGLEVKVRGGSCSSKHEQAPGYL